MNDRVTTDRRSHLYVRRCVECGYDGSLLRDGRAPRCARCGCDLLLRPARSYAEMEGLGNHHPPPAPAHTVLQADHRTRSSTAATLIERWLWFAFLSLLLLFAIAVLAANAISNAP